MIIIKAISLLPADIYTVYNKTILTEVDRDNLISLYEPIIGTMATSLYLTLIRDLGKVQMISRDFTHHHLMSILKAKLDDILLARETLEGVGLLKSYLKQDEVNSYVYELYSPLSANEFFNHPVFNIILYNNIGKKEYDMLRKSYELLNINLKEYEDVSKPINMTFKSSTVIESNQVRKQNTAELLLESLIDYNLVISSLPKNLINEKTFNKRTKELINNLAFIYNVDSIKMVEFLRLVINEKGCIDKEELRKVVGKFYQYNNNGTLPTLIYRTQPEYLKSPDGDTSQKGKIIYIFENTSPYDFLKNKYKGNPTTRDLKILEQLIIDVGLKPAVVNVLIDYVLKKDNNKLNINFIETLAGHWKRVGVETAIDAMNLAKKEHNKLNKKITTNTKFKKEEIKKPAWFDDKINKEQMNEEEQKELEDMLKGFR